MAKSYTVTQVDPVAKTIVVAFTQDAVTLALNILAPGADVTLDDWVLQNWPSAAFARLADATITTTDAAAKIGDPPTTLASGPTAAEAYQAKIAAGITVASAGTPAMDATYGLDDVTVNQIKGMANDFSGGLGLPGGGATFGYPILGGGSANELSGPNIVALYKAMRDLRAVIDQQYAILQQGGTPVWPSQSVAIA